MSEALVSKTRPEKSGDEKRLGHSENPSTLKMFEREDWVLFRTVEGLQQKAGVAKEKLSRLVLKELADNALDDAADVNVRRTAEGRLLHRGRWSRHRRHARRHRRACSRSTARWSQPSCCGCRKRGALGNGLRVVAGAVLASAARSRVTTRNRRIVLRPELDGTTTVVNVKEVKFPVGTRVEISFGPALPCDANALVLGANGAAAGAIGVRLITANPRRTGTTFRISRVVCCQRRFAGARSDRAPRRRGVPG